ncbi:MAG: hypothetical protein QME05_05430 [Candidatus Margulisbacteria bacterium]|nr:hypothetical protein [Candidatus Margulisiibacteriota bacterium]
MVNKKRPMKVRGGRKGQKALKVKKGKKAIKVKKTTKTIKVVKGPKEKVLGKIDHYFDKISVAALKVTAPIKVGAVIHVKGHTTDFVQKIDSMQIEHASVIKAGKGSDVGIKVKEKVRAGDKVYQAAVPAITKPIVAAPVPQLPKPEIEKKTDPYSNTKFLKF